MRGPLIGHERCFGGTHANPGGLNPAPDKICHELGRFIDGGLHRELARVRFEEGLCSRQIAARLGIPRTTAIKAIDRLERAGGASMTAFIKWSVGIKVALLATGQIKSRTLAFGGCLI